MFSPVVKSLALFCALSFSAHAATNVSSARIWPAQDYTRLTLEAKEPIQSKMFAISNPQRLVIDLEDVELSDTLNNLTKLIGNDDPYIKSVRVGNFKPGIVRLVLDLKGDVKPQLFELKPVGDYGHRLVLDIYPTQPNDPFLGLLEPAKTEPHKEAATASKPILTAASSIAAVPTITPPPKPTAAVVDNKPKPSVARTEPAKPEPSKIEQPAKVEASKPETPANTPELRNRTVTIAIDAGHGGEDPGAHGRNGTLEKNVTLAIAKKVKALVDATPHMRGVLVRDGDYFIPLGGRVTKARNVRADLFVSIHADAFISPDAKGSSVFALSEHGATSTAARWLAKKENEADLIGGVNIAVKDPYLARTLLDLSQTATNNDSLKLAKYVLKELGEINTLHRGHVEQAGFAVLKSPDIPSILVETAFISNPGEEARLNDESYQHKLADAVVSGIKRYFAQSPSFSKHKVAKND